MNSIAVIGKGYKPHVSRELLEVSPETLRYWRKHVDPKPHRPHFSSGRLLAYRVIKAWVRKKHLPVEILEQCQWDRVFKACESVTRDKLSSQYLVLNEKTHELSFQGPNQRLSVDDLDIHVLPMRPVVQEHTEALLTFGSLS